MRIAYSASMGLNILPNHTYALQNQGFYSVVEIVCQRKKKHSTRHIYCVTMGRLVCFVFEPFRLRWIFVLISFHFKH